MKQKNREQLSKSPEGLQQPTNQPDQLLGKWLSHFPSASAVLNLNWRVVKRGFRPRYSVMWWGMLGERWQQRWRSSSYWTWPTVSSWSFYWSGPLVLPDRCRPASSSLVQMDLVPQCWMSLRSIMHVRHVCVQVCGCYHLRLDLQCCLWTWSMCWSGDLCRRLATLQYCTWCSSRGESHIQCVVHQV